jgi:hypothetical protein
MKAKIFFMLASVLLLTGIYGCWTVTQEGYTNQSSDSQSYTSEYNPDDLNSYGQWIVLPEYGRVWRPSVDAQWQPFADGHWVYDGNDWVWDSYESYGAIVYHYGNWEYVSNERWVWIPNHARWSPACVDWVYYGDRVAWAPRPRPGHSFGNPWDNRGDQAWVVVRNENFYDNHVNNHRISDATRDNGKYRDDQITRRPPPVSYVREHTQTQITVTQGINRNGKLHPSRPADNTPATGNGNSAPAVGRPSSTATPSRPAIGQQTPTQPPAAQPTTTTQAPVKTGRDPNKPEPTPNTGGTTTPTAINHPAINGQTLDHTPIKPQQPVKTTTKGTRGTRHSVKRTAAPQTQQSQPAQSTPKVKKDTPVRDRPQPAPARDKEEKKVESR